MREFGRVITCGICEAGYNPFYMSGLLSLLLGNFTPASFLEFAVDGCLSHCYNKNGFIVSLAEFDADKEG